MNHKLAPGPPTWYLMACFCSPLFPFMHLSLSFCSRQVPGQASVSSGSPSAVRSNVTIKGQEGPEDRTVPVPHPDRNLLPAACPHTRKGTPCSPAGFSSSFAGLLPPRCPWSFSATSKTHSALKSDALQKPAKTESGVVWPWPSHLTSPSLSLLIC